MCKGPLTGSYPSREACRREEHHKRDRRLCGSADAAAFTDGEKRLRERATEEAGRVAEVSNQQPTKAMLLEKGSVIHEYAVA